MDMKRFLQHNPTIVFTQLEDHSAAVTRKIISYTALSQFQNLTPSKSKQNKALLAHLRSTAHWRATNSSIIQLLQSHKLSK